MRFAVGTSSGLVDIDPNENARSTHATEDLTQSTNICTPLHLHKELAEPCFKKTCSMERPSVLKRKQREITIAILSGWRFNEDLKRNHCTDEKLSYNTMDWTGSNKL